ncbi:MAG: hypothetical protein AB7F86_10915, partial [Bdellovibrionales bacterium]
HLPPEQTVFTPQESLFLNFIIGALVLDFNSAGVYRTMKSLKPYPIHAQVRPDRVSILGQVGGKLMPVLEYAPPTLFKLLFPSK